MNKHKVIIGCPAQRFTGGPTLAHQLCKELTNQGYDASMYYYNRRKKEYPVHDKYKVYGNKYVETIDDHEDLILITPETNPDLLKCVKRGKKVIWWMSVDNYYDKYLTSIKNKIKNVFGLLKYDIDSKDTMHFAQSYYAINYLLNRGIDHDRVFYVSDYLDDIFIDNAIKNVHIKKTNTILYSPKRGLDISNRLIDRLPDYEWTALENLSQPEMISLMQKSKLYIDFGNHPGKDRIPREAVINGCCLITGLRGSAGNDRDINIPSDFKFHETDLDGIEKKIHDTILKYDLLYTEMDDYKAKILLEHETFSSDVSCAMKIIMKK